MDFILRLGKGTFIFCLETALTATEVDVPHRKSECPACSLYLPQRRRDNRETIAKFEFRNSKLILRVLRGSAGSPRPEPVEGRASVARCPKCRFIVAFQPRAEARIRWRTPG